VRAALAAILLISRDRLSRGETDDLIAQSLNEYRMDLDGYKANKAAWPDVRENGPLTKPKHIAYYQELILATDRLVEKMARHKRQFNSLLELDNALISQLKGWEGNESPSGKRHPGRR